jgi:preprotein translocase subunit SecD
LPGPAPLPQPGDLLDPSLTPFAPAAGVGLATSHVDPITGRRGVAFVLPGGSQDAFRSFATARPREYVAIVRDGIVLGVNAIEDRIAHGIFTFTGDYTEGEVREMVSSFEAGPQVVDIRLDRVLEVPTAR